MNTLIFRTFAPILTALMLLVSLFILLRGHNAPGGGFIGGLIAAAAFAVQAAAFGPLSVRQALRVSPIAVAGGGLLISCAAGLLSAAFGVPFMTGLWVYPALLGVEVPLSSVMAFDLGVYLVVVGALTAIALALDEGEEP